MLQFIGDPTKQFCEKCAIKIAEQIGDGKEHFEEGYEEGRCYECGKIINDKKMEKVTNELFNK